MSDTTDIFRNALSLGVSERAALAEKLLASLEEPSEKEAEHLWADEAQRRLEECRSGKAVTVSADDVHEKANGLIQ